MAMKGTSSTVNIGQKSNTYSPPKEMIAVIRGSWNQVAKQTNMNEVNSGVHISGDLQNRFMEFAKNHDIIHVTPVNVSAGHEIVLVVRYKP